MENTVKNKSYAFALRIIKAYRFLSTEHGESKADFIHKMNIALKEANETEYWLMLLHDSDYLESKVFESVVEDCREIIKLLISIIKTSKKNKNN